jgi:glycosyltransferase involved in cell wall biosynthesis
VRVLIVNHLAAQHLGGSELSMLGLVANWRQHHPDLEAHVLSPAPGTAMERAALAEGWSASVAPYGGWVSFRERETAARRRLERSRAREYVDAILTVLVEVRPDLVVLNTVVTPWAAVAARERQIPVAWFIREFVVDRPGFRLREGRDATLHAVDELADLLFTNSLAVRDSIADVIRRDRVEVAHPVIDLDAVQRAIAHRTPAPAPREPLRIGLLGRVTPEKGQRTAIAALALLHAQGVDARLDIIGGVILPGFDLELRRLAHHAGIADRVRLVGERSRPLEHLARTDVSLVSSPREAFGRVTLESLALGMPVIASTEGGAPELVEHGTSGFLVDTTDPGAIAHAVARYASDRALLATHGDAATLRAAAVLSGPFAVTATVALLDELVARGPSAGPAPQALFTVPPVSTVGRLALEIGDAVATMAQRIARLIRDPKPPVQRRWRSLRRRVQRRDRRG